MNISNDREAAEELNELFQSVFVKEEDKDIIAFKDFARLCFETEVAEPFDFKGKIATRERSAEGSQAGQENGT